MRAAAGPGSEIRGFVRREEVLDLYRRATLLVYPSAYEGFGLPVVEAMAARCPVLCARNSALVEVGGSAAIFLDDVTPEGIARALTEALADRDALARRGEEGRAGGALLVARGGDGDARRLPAGDPRMSDAGRPAAPGRWRPLVAHSYRLGGRVGGAGREAAAAGLGPGGRLPAARAARALALLRAGRAWLPSPSTGDCLDVSSPKLLPSLLQRPGARALDGGQPPARRGGALAGPRPGARPARGGRAGDVVRGRLVRRGGLRLGDRARRGRRRRRGDGRDLAGPAAGRGPAPDHQRGGARPRRPGRTGRSTAGRPRRAGGTSSSGATRRRACASASSGCRGRSTAEEYVRERRPLHERFFAARPASFLAGGLLTLVCPGNFAPVAGPADVPPGRHGVAYLRLRKPG